MPRARDRFTGLPWLAMFPDLQKPGSGALPPGKRTMGIVYSLSTLMIDGYVLAMEKQDAIWRLHCNPVRDRLLPYLPVIRLSYAGKSLRKVLGTAVWETEVLGNPNNRYAAVTSEVVRWVR